MRKPRTRCFSPSGAPPDRESGARIVECAAADRRALDPSLGIDDEIEDDPSADELTGGRGAGVSTGSQLVYVAAHGPAEIVLLDSTMKHGHPRDPDADPCTAELWAMYLDPHHWRQGVGRALWACARDYLVSAGFNAITLWTLRENTRAVSFYQGIGFVVDSGHEKTRDRAGEAVVEIRMKLQLPSSQREPASSLRSRIESLLADPLDLKLARSILGTTSVEAIASRVEAYCLEEFHSNVAACETFTQSVGAVFVLRLDSGERVVLKAHGSDESRWGTAGSVESLAAVYEVQAEVARRGFPCAEVLRPVASWGNGALVAMTYLNGSVAADPGSASARHAMAETCAEFVGMVTPFRNRPYLPVSRLPNGQLWPKPHNVLFDLEMPGGEWIDDLARSARAILDAAPPVLTLMHTDFSAANVRVREGRVTAVYDMDSVALADEVRVLASTAVHYTYTGEKGSRWPSREEACAFVADYQRARGELFTPAELERLDAAAIYALGYTARSEHSLDPEGRTLQGSMREILRTAPERFLSEGI